MMNNRLLTFFLTATAVLAASCQSEKLTDYVNPFVGTTTLWKAEDLGYTPQKLARAWGAEAFPGATLPNAMVQATPVTAFRSGSGYQYEDKVIYGFAHTSKGHWNLLHLPVLPVTGEVGAVGYESPFSHENESAHPGYYQVYLEKYGVNAELTTTLRCAFHKYTFNSTDEKKVLVDITRTNNHVRDWSIEKVGDNAFAGNQDAEGNIRFYALCNYPVSGVEMVRTGDRQVAVVSFDNSVGAKPLEMRIGFSFVSVDNAKMNLEAEMAGKSFDQVRKEADATWNELLSAIQVKGGSEKDTKMFYSTLFHAFEWPCLRSDVNGDYTDVNGNVANGGFRYYTKPSFWDDYRNKLILLGMVSPDVATDVLKTIIDMGEKSGGYMPTFFHGDHASTFVSGSWLRGIKDFDLKRAYDLILKNATVPGKGGRPYLDEYLANGWIAEKDTTNVPTWDEYKAAVTKTVEYAYDDYATALVAKELGDDASYKLLMDHSMNYKNLFDPSTGFWRGKIADGSWIKDFDPYYPYYAYMFREANAWESLFFAPHDPEGMIALYPSHEAVDMKLDSLFSEPWRNYEAHNMTGFIGNYCHGNQPGHSIPYTYYFIDKQEKAQVVIDSLLNHYYGMGEEGLAYAGMDDAGEMSSWYVFNAIGLYTYSPADPEYIVTVPLFSDVKFRLGNGKSFTVKRKGNGRKITDITCGGKRLDGWFVTHEQLENGKELVIGTEGSR